MSLTVPSLVGIDDPPSMGPPPPVDPEVARLLALLRLDAKGSPQDPRPGVRALDAVNFALSQVGLPYEWGAVGPESYDCSGLTWRAYEQAGVTLPRVSADQHASGGTPVAIADLLPGDLVFFATVSWDPGVVHHVGMYVGQGLMVDAPHPGAFVRVEPVTASGYVGAVRVVAERRPATTARKHPVPRPTDTGSPAVPSPSTGPTPSPSESGHAVGSGDPEPFAHGPAQRPAERPTQRPAERPAQRPAERPADRSTERSGGSGDRRSDAWRRPDKPGRRATNGLVPCAGRPPAAEC